MAHWISLHLPRFFKSALKKLHYEASSTTRIIGCFQTKPLCCGSNYLWCTCPFGSACMYLMETAWKRGSWCFQVNVVYLFGVKAKWRDVLSLGLPPQVLKSECNHSNHTVCFPVIWQWLIKLCLFCPFSNCHFVSWDSTIMIIISYGFLSSLLYQRA